MAPDSKFKRLYQVWKGDNCLQRFFCRGRCIFGPDVASLLLSLFMITGPTITFCYQIIVKIQWQEKLHEADWIHDHHHVLGFPALLVTIIIMLADLSFLLLTSSRDPGIMPRNAQSIDSEDASYVNTPSMEWSSGGTPHMKFPQTMDTVVNGSQNIVTYASSIAHLALLIA